MSIRKYASENYVNENLDWDKLQNRPFYETEPVETIVYESDSVASFSENITDTMLIEGKVYTVVYDRVTYECIARNDGHDDIYIGNQTVSDGWEFSETIESDEPFFFATYKEDSWSTISFEDGESHAISIFEFVTEVIQLDEKYLPELHMKQDIYWEMTTDCNMVNIEQDWWAGDAKSGYFNNSYPFTLDENTTYAVQFDGKTHYLTSFSSQDSLSVILGNGAYWSGDEEDNGLDFAIMHNHEGQGYTTWIIVSETPGEHSVVIYNALSGSISKLFINVADSIDNKPGIKVEGDVFNINGSDITAGIGAEVFNDYENNKASGKYSHAEGCYTTASGYASHAEGEQTTASGSYSHAEGFTTTASGYASHTEGFTTTASGQNSHAEGYITTASGQASHTEGFSTTASGQASHAEGYSTTAYSHSHAEGRETTASGQYGAHAEGYLTTASGMGAHSEGMFTLASGQYQHVQGKNNIEDTSNTYAHIVGNGEDYSARSNAHTLDWDGNAWYQGSVEATAIILSSPNGTRFKITVGDDGVLSAAEITIE